MLTDKQTNRTGDEIANVNFLRRHRNVQATAYAR